MKYIFKYTMIIMLIAMLIGFANMYPIIKYTALIAFISFIIYKIKKYKSKPSKEEMARFEAEYEAEYQAKLRENDEIEIPKSVYFAEDDEEFVKEFGKPTRNGYFSDNPKIIKNVRYLGENDGPRNDFDLIAYNNLSYDIRYDVKNKIYKIIDMDKNYEMYKIDYAIVNGYIYETEYNKNTDTLELYYLRKK